VGGKKTDLKAIRRSKTTSKTTRRRIEIRRS